MILSSSSFFERTQIEYLPRVKNALARTCIYNKRPWLKTNQGRSREQAMGIPKYHAWMESRYKKAFLKPQWTEADHVYLDCNFLLHEIGRKARTAAEFIQLFFKKLDQLFAAVVARKTVFIALDGPASAAKTYLQRKRRRERAAKEEKIYKSFSSNSFTPGTPFMRDLEAALEWYFADRMSGGWMQCGAVVLSGASVPGEGEHKILEFLLRQEDRWAANHTFISGDADLFLLSLVQDEARRISIVNDLEFRGKRASLQIWSSEVLAIEAAKEAGLIKE